MKRIFFFLSLFFLGTGAWAQIVFDERGLSEDLPYPQWTTPTPACYDIAAEAHRTLIDMRRNWDSNDDPYCDGGSRDNGVCVEAKSTGFTTSYGTTASHYRTSAASGGAEIFYPPFANVNIRYIVQKGGAAGDDYVRFRRETWYAADLKVSGAGITDNTFSDLDHLRYSSYLFDETGAARVTYPNVNSSCPFKNDGGWANQLLCATASAVRFNRAPIISDDMETSAHVKTNIVKALYYGDADKNTDLTLSTAVGNGSVRTYCFAPLVGHSEFFAYQTKDFNMEGQDTKTQAHGAFYSKQEGSKSGAHNYRFKVTDWDKPALRSQVSIYNDATFPNVKKLNNGLEVFIVVLAGEVKQYTATATTHVGGNVTFYGKPRLLRTHVYPIKPKWNRVKFRNNFCVSDGVVDLKEYVDMGSAGTAHCVFEAVEGGVERLLDAPL